MKLLPAFILLQLMDVATTIVALNLGAAEQNPVIGRLMALGPIPGLIMSKLVVIGLAALFLTWGKTRALRLANVAFGLIVTWNLTIIGRLAWLTIAFSSPGVPLVWGLALDLPTEDLLL